MIDLLSKASHPAIYMCRISNTQGALIMIRKHRTLLYSLFTALLTTVGFLFCLYRMQLYPFGGNSILRIDLESQYADFIHFFNNSSTAEKIYSFSKGFGGPTTGLAAYYTISPFNFLFALFSPRHTELAVLVLLLCKFIFMGQGAYWYLNKHFSVSPLNIFFASVYALYPYFIRYYFNILWLDCFALLPFLLLGAERIIEGRGIWPFTVLFTLSLVCNYYISYMSALFIVPYFFWYALAKRKLRPARTARLLLPMAGSALLSILLAAPLLLPTLSQLLNGKLSSGDGFDRTKPMFQLPLMLSALFDGTHFLDSFPVFTAGVCTVFLLAVFFTCRRAYTAENLSLALLFCCVAASTYFPLLYYIWHGLAWPVGFAPRFTHVYALLLVLLCRRAADWLDGRASLRALALMAPLYAAAFLFYRSTPHLAWSGSILLATIVSLVLCVLIGLVFFRCRRAATVVLCLFLTANLFVNSSMHAIRETVVDKERTSAAFSYESNYAAVDTALAAIDDSSFYRLEELDAKSPNQSLALNYNGINHFSSAFDAQQLEMYTHFGGTVDFYSTTYTDCNLLRDSFLGLKYILAEDPSTVPDEYIPVVHSQKSVFLNPYSFPVFFTADTAEVEYFDSGAAHINAMTQTLAGQTVLLSDGSIDKEALQTTANMLQSAAAEVISQDGGNLLLSANGNWLLTTVPYDECWRAEVNGNPVTPVLFMEYFLAVPLKDGVCDISLRYVPKGLSTGCALCAAGLLAAAATVICKHRRSRRTD